jgi:cytochrome c
LSARGGVALAAVLAVLTASVASASELDARIAAANLKRGQLLFLACKGCHDLEAGVPHKVGPNLHGVVGRRAGASEGFRYSEALVQSGIVWTPETLDNFLRQPGAMVRGNGMAFAGIANDADRANLIAWMLANGAGG